MTIDFDPGRRNPTDFGYSFSSLPVAEQDFDPSTRQADCFRLPRTKPGEIIRALLDEPPKILGIDVSHYNAEGHCDFKAIRESGVDFVFYKCSESDWYTDETFEDSWRRADGEGLPVIPYHFFRGNKSGEVQYSRLMSSIEAFLNYFDGYAAVMVDVETADGVDKDTRASRFFDLCRRIKGESLLDGGYCSPGLVTTLFPANDTRWNNLAFQHVAHWTSATTYTLPSGWSRDKVKFWQFGIYPTYSWCPPVQGAGNAVDVDWGYFATQAELKAWLGQGSVTPPGVYPYMARVIVADGTLVREAPKAGRFLRIEPQGAGVTVFGSDEDIDGAIWLDVGSGWLRAEHVEAV